MFKIDYKEIPYKEVNKVVIFYNHILEGFEKQNYMWSVQNKGSISDKIKMGFFHISNRIVIENFRKENLEVEGKNIW